MTGNSSLYPNEWLTFTGSECSNNEDEMIQYQCWLVMTRFLYELLTGPRDDDRPFHFKSQKNALSSWFSLWENETAKKFGHVTNEVKRKLQLYGAIGACMIRTYWVQNLTAERPISVHAHSDKHPYPHPHGGDDIRQSFHEVREVTIEWIRAVRTDDLVYGSRPRAGYDPVVLVIYKFNAWEYIPDIELRRDHMQLRFEKKYRREEKGFRDMILVSNKVAEDRNCVRASWLYKQHHGAWPVAVVHYHVLTGLSIVCWPVRAPKILKPSELKPYKLPRRGKEKPQLNLDIVQPPHPYPFENVPVKRSIHLDVPWGNQESENKDG